MSQSDFCPNVIFDIGEMFGHFGTVFPWRYYKLQRNPPPPTNNKEMSIPTWKSISDTVASGRSREDRLPGLLISKTNKTRRTFCIRAGVYDHDETSMASNKKMENEVRMSSIERGSAIPICHLSLARVVEVAETVEALEIEKKGGLQKYTCCVETVDEIPMYGQHNR